MPKPATIEDAPHQLKLLHDNGKTTITISLALLSLSVAFAEKLVKLPLDVIQAVLLAFLWFSLVFVLIAGLYTVSHVNSVSFHYMLSFRAVYPDALALIGSGCKIKADDPDEIQFTDIADQAKVNEPYGDSTRHLKKAYFWARWSLRVMGASSILVVLIGLYGFIYKGFTTDASSAIESALRFVPKHYKFPVAVAQFESLTFDSSTKLYTVTVRNTLTAALRYEVTIDSASGNITKVNVKP